MLNLTQRGSPAGAAILKTCASVSEGSGRGKPDDASKTLARRVALPARDIDVWLMSLNVPDDEIRQYAMHLSRDEQMRAERFHFERDRRRYLVARGMLRILLGRQLDRAPADIVFWYEPHGKPRVAATTPPLHFNVAHSSDMALYAISHHCVPGVDIEHLDRDIDVAAFAQRFFTPRECADLLRIPAAGQKRALLTLWTRKEAVVKSIGAGLQFPLHDFEVTAAPDAPPRLLHITSGCAADWTLYPIDAGGEYVATVAAYRASAIRTAQ